MGLLNAFGGDKETPRVTLGRNDPCHCGSGKKYKKCHLAKDEEAERKALEKATFVKPTEEAKSAKPGTKSHVPSKKEGGWFNQVVGRVFRPGATRPKTMGGAGNKGG